MIFKLTIRRGQRCMLCDSVQFKYSNRFHPSVEQILSRKRLLNCTNQHFSYLQHNSEFHSRCKTRQNSIDRKTPSGTNRHHSNANSRLRVGCLMGYGNKIFSPVSRNDVTRSPGKKSRLSLVPFGW